MDHVMPADDFDYVVAKLAQMHALLISITADGFESFEDLHPKLRHDILWLASDLADEAHRRLIGHVDTAAETSTS